MGIMNYVLAMYSRVSIRIEQFGVHRVKDGMRLVLDIISACYYVLGLGH
jgi:hypothetical protein